MLKTANEIADTALTKIADQVGYEQQDAVPQVGAPGGQRIPTSPQRDMPVQQTQQAELAYPEGGGGYSEAEIEELLRQLPPEYIQYLSEQPLIQEARQPQQQQPQQYYQEQPQQYYQEQPQQYYQEQPQQYMKQSAAQKSIAQKAVEENSAIDKADQAAKQVGGPRKTKPTQLNYYKRPDGTDTRSKAASIANALAVKFAQ
jgi:hypothetical protein